MQIHRHSTAVKTRSVHIALCMCAIAVSSAVAAVTIARPLRIPADRPALLVAKATSANIVSATRAGATKHIVAVGDHGVVLLSADEGRHFMQASGVPVQSMLTDVKFVDAQHGWAVGHDGVVLASHDGGNTWNLQRRDDKARTPLLGVWFENLQHGFAVGQFGTAIETHDGGTTWADITPAGVSTELAEQHLNAIHGRADGLVVIVGERGLTLVSNDHGAHWQAHPTGKNGSLWSVLPLRDGSLIAAGIRGHLYRSFDNGEKWRPIESGVADSLTGIAQMGDGSVVVVGYGGVILRSENLGQSFSNTAARADRLPLSAVVGGMEGPVLFSVYGVVPTSTVAP